MSVGSIGSTPSFFQQDQDYWNQAQNWDAVQSADAALINVMGTAEVDQAKGLASIANKTALSRVNSQISALVQQVLQGSTGTSTSSSSSGTTGSASTSSSSSSSSSGTPAAPATAIGTVRLTTGTPLSTLGILPGGSVTISAGNNGTTYTSTGTDTVGDLINTLNVDLPTNAQVTASVNKSGQLVITSRNDSDTIAIIGSGTDAAVLGFGVGNNSFAATKASPAPSSASTATTSSTASTGTSGSSGSSKNASKALPSNLALAEQGLSTAQGILAADGVSGTLVNLLA
jgi:hypothetical protein